MPGPAVDCVRRTSTCRGCGKSLACRSVIGRLPKWCDSCRKAEKAKGEKGRRRKSRQQLQVKLCEQCGQEWTPKIKATRFCGPRCRSLASGKRVVLSCACCGKSFESCSSYAKDRKYCSRKCSREHRGMKERICVECGNVFKRTPTRRDKAKYCGKKCYFAARNAGRQPWDRTGQLEGVWHRGGRWACAPSRKPMQEMRTNMQRFLAKITKLYSRASKKQKACEVCGSKCYGPKARFCSLSCLSKSRQEVPCRRCGASCVAHGVSRMKMCECCKREVAAAIRRRRKKEVGSYRKRCRTYGGSYNAEVTRRKVFERDAWRCHVCNKKTIRHWANNHPREATVDHHPIPLSRGGDHDWHNVRCACRKCNSEKSNTWDGQQRLKLIG